MTKAEKAELLKRAVGKLDEAAKILSFAEEQLISEKVGLTLDGLARRLRCAKCGGSLLSIKPWRQHIRAARAWGRQDRGNLNCSAGWLRDITEPSHP